MGQSGTGAKAWARFCVAAPVGRCKTRAASNTRQKESGRWQYRPQPSPPGPRRGGGAVAEGRLWQRHMDLARIGATGRGGVNRQALIPEDVEARLRVLGWAATRGFSASVDAIGNVFIRRPGSDPTASPVVAGSHLDTQPTGGNFDGVYGVLAAVEVLEAASDAGGTTDRPARPGVGGIK